MPSPLPTELRKQVESAELRNQRLKEVFQAKVQEFRKVCYTLTGYQVDITRESQYRLTSMYAERQDDCLVFKVGLRAGGTPLVSRAPCHAGGRLWSGGLSQVDPGKDLGCLSEASPEINLNRAGVGTFK